MRRSHAGAGLFAVEHRRLALAAVVGGGVTLFFESGGAGDDAFAGCEEIGLHASIAGRSARREVRNAIGVRHFAMSGADGDGEIGIAGIGDIHFAIAGFGSAGSGDDGGIAAIAGGDDDGHAAADQAVDLDTERALTAGKPARIKIVSETHVDAVDEQAAAVLSSTVGSDRVAMRSQLTLPWPAVCWVTAAVTCRR